jgi:hypothetical protein
MNAAGFPKSCADEMANGVSDVEANSDRRRMVQKANNVRESAKNVAEEVKNIVSGVERTQDQQRRLQRKQATPLQMQKRA